MAGFMPPPEKEDIMRHFETDAPVPPARYAAQHSIGPGFGFSLTRIHHCACGYTCQGSARMARHIEEESRLDFDMADPTLPGVDLGEEDAR